MSSRHSAARPKRAGEQFARRHHGESFSSSPNKKPKFDIRNPSALAPDAPEEDTVLQADVIGAGGLRTKRGAVNLDGYDSDSDNDGFDARAEERAKVKGKRAAEGVNLAEAFESASGDGRKHEDENTDELGNGDNDDMFADSDEEMQNAEADDDGKGKCKKRKDVRFMEADEIVGQVESSKSGGHVSGNFALDPKGKLSTHAMDDQVSSDDEEDAALNAIEEDIDEEVGAGGLKRNAPKVDAFNMKNEQEEGRFDEAGNFVRKAADPDAKHDVWLEGVSKKEMKKAAEAHEKREAELRRKRLEDDAALLPDILRVLIQRLEKGETVLEALARLGRGQTKAKKVPKWKLKKQQQQQKSRNGHDGVVIADTSQLAEDPEQVKIRESVNAITGAADQLLTRGQMEIYEQEREILIRQYRRETGEEWVESLRVEPVPNSVDGPRPVKMWEYRWTDQRDGGVKQGPYDGSTMLSWKDAGYFGEGVEFRKEGDTGPWSRAVDFL